MPSSWHMLNVDCTHQVGDSPEIHGVVCTDHRGLEIIEGDMTIRYMTG
jgi:hypothetical protein